MEHFPRFAREGHNRALLLISLAKSYDKKIHIIFLVEKKEGRKKFSLYGTPRGLPAHIGIMVMEEGRRFSSVRGLTFLLPTRYVGNTIPEHGKK